MNQEHAPPFSMSESLAVMLLTVIYHSSLTGCLLSFRIFVLCCAREKSMEYQHVCWTGLQVGLDRDCVRVGSKSFSSAPHTVQSISGAKGQMLNSLHHNFEIKWLQLIFITHLPLLPLWSIPHLCSGTQDLSYATTIGSLTFFLPRFF